MKLINFFLAIFRRINAKFLIWRQLASEVALAQVIGQHDRLVKELAVQYRDAEKHGWLPPATEKKLRAIIAKSNGLVVIEAEEATAPMDPKAALIAVKRILDKQANATTGKNK